MAVYYKFKSAKDFDSVSIDGHFITVGNLKERIFECKQLGRGTDYDLVVINAQTNEEYLDEATLIPKNTSVLIRRIPGQPRKPIVTGPPTDQEQPVVESKPESVQPAKNSFIGADQSIYSDGYDEFGNDLYEIPEVAPAISGNLVQDVPPPTKADEDSKIQALVETPALDWQQTSDGFGPGRGFGRGVGGRMGGRGFGRGGFERKTPPEGYVCHRCKTPGHFIQHCPTNGDPNFDIKRVKPPTGIPRSMLVATPDGSYALPSGAAAVLKPNEAAFEKEIEGLPTTRNVGELPPELHCPLCKQVMKDAVLTSKCCFRSFCDKCIRDHIISKATCVCGAINILADDLLPNKTVRDTISRILESGNSSAEKGGSAFHVQDMESARCAPPLPKIPSPSLSVASKGEQAPSQLETTKVQAAAGHDESPVVQQEVLEKGTVTKVPDVSEATYDSRSMKGPASQGSARPADGEVQQKQVPGEAAKKKKKKKVHLPLDAAEMQWRNPQGFAPESFMMPPGPSPYNPYWNNMQPGMEAYMGAYVGTMPPYMGYGVGPMNVPFGTPFPHDPFLVPGNMMPPFVPPQRDLAELAMHRNARPPIMSREEFEARKAELRRKRELEKREGSRELLRDHESRREFSGSGDAASMKLKSRAAPSRLPPSTVDGHRHSNRDRYERRGEERPPSPERRYKERPTSLERRHRERPLSPERRHREKPSSPERRHRERQPSAESIPPRVSSKRKSSHEDNNYDHDHEDDRHKRRSHRRSESSVPRPPPAPATVEESPEDDHDRDRKHKPSVFSRIRFSGKEELAEEEPTAKKRKATPSSSGATVAHSGKSHRKDKATSSSKEEHNHHHYHKKSSSAAAVEAVGGDYETSDDDEDERHFKRRPSRYESSPPAKYSDRERAVQSSKHG